MVLAGWVRLDNRIALCTALEIPCENTVTDPAIILASYQKWGATCVDKFEGDFSFALYDPTRKELFCARDSIGARPLFYWIDDTKVMVASTAAAFQGVKGCPLSPRQEWLARFLVLESAHPTYSAFDGLKKLAPAHHLTVARSGETEPVQYWTMDPASPMATARSDHWVQAYREKFDRVVEDRLVSSFPISGENSGGLDSATILGHAIDHLPHHLDDFRCYSVCHLEDEPQEILSTAMHIGIRHNHVTARPRFYQKTAILDRAIRVIGYPAEHSHASFHSDFFEQCQIYGSRTMLSGYGGDEVVTFQAKSLAKELFLSGHKWQALAEMDGPVYRRFARWLLWNTRGLSPRTPTNVRTGSLLNSLLRQDVTREFDIEAAEKEGGINRAMAQTINEEILARRGFTKLRTGRLEGCALMAQSYGIEYRWPLFDRRLIAQYLATPSIEKCKGNLGRYLHRRACQGLAPDPIINRQSKDLGTSPFIHRGTYDGVVRDFADLDPRLQNLIDPARYETHQLAMKQGEQEEKQWLKTQPARRAVARVNELAHWLETTEH